MQVQYHGPHDGVLVVLPNGMEVEVPRGGLLQTSEEHAESLLRQVANWRIPKRSRSHGSKEPHDTASDEAPQEAPDAADHQAPEAPQAAEPASNPAPEQAPDTAPEQAHDNQEVTP
jgi:hypothetical protein